MPEKSPLNRPDYSVLSKLSTVGMAIVILTLSGHWLDVKFQTSSIFTLIGAALGILYSLYEAWAIINSK